MPKIIVYTDGSCLGNPGPGGWAFLLLEEQSDGSMKVIFQQSGSAFATTNNRMEMMGLLEALKKIVQKYSFHHVQIYSDSNLLVQSINQGWKRKANLDLWREIEKYLPKLNFKIDWVKAHATDRYNNQCDELALAAAKKAQRQSLAKSPKKTSSKKPGQNISGQASLF